MNRKHRVSIEDVARRAKVSITTVSRVINRVPTVSRKNQSRVEEAIAFLKFKPDISAQRLARGVNTAIGLVMPGYPGIFHSYYAIELVRGIGHACEILKLDLVFHITNGYNQLNMNSVGGIIFADTIENRRQIELAIDTEMPCMVINNIVKDMKVNYIGIDNFGGTLSALDYLVSLGHTRIGTITGTLKTQAGLFRFEGYKETLKKYDIPLRDEYVIEGDYSRRSARFAAEKLLEQKDRPTAIFAASDEMALETISVVLEKGLKIPEEISIMGFDDSPAAIYGPVALTTVKQPLFQMAEQAVKDLYQVVQGKNPMQIQKVMSPQLIIRESCAPPR